MEIAGEIDVKIAGRCPRPTGFGTCFYDPDSLTQKVTSNGYRVRMCCTRPRRLIKIHHPEQGLVMFVATNERLGLGFLMQLKILLSHPIRLLRRNSILKNAVPINLEMFHWIHDRSELLDSKR
tara:strand:- start:138 stop:506 length:369 start_codon:yes stop_codon:yes gene_type:complete